MRVRSHTRTLVRLATLTLLLALAIGGVAAAATDTGVPARRGAHPWALQRPRVHLRPPKGCVVVIDPGHQARADLTPEPIGPGSSVTKPSVSAGTSGYLTHTPESLVALQVALKLKTALEARGVRVVMVRTSQEVDIPNSQRAEMANAARADLFIRLHCDGSTDHSVHGLSTLVPSTNSWTAPIVAPSGAAGRLIHSATIAATGAKDLGVVGRSDLSGFNWSRVPVVLPEMGFLTNAAEEKLLVSSAYQTKLANGMANGIVAYLSTLRVR